MPSRRVAVTVAAESSATGLKEMARSTAARTARSRPGVVGVDDQTVRKVTATGGGDDAGRSGRQPRERRRHVIV